jgi:hypothetical protein
VRVRSFQEVADEILAAMVGTRTEIAREGIGDIIARERQVGALLGLDKLEALLSSLHLDGEVMFAVKREIRDVRSTLTLAGGGK